MDKVFVEELLFSVTITVSKEKRETYASPSLQIKQTKKLRAVNSQCSQGSASPGHHPLPAALREGDRGVGLNPGRKQGEDSFYVCGIASSGLR